MSPDLQSPFLKRKGGKKTKNRDTPKFSWEGERVGQYATFAPRQAIKKV